MIYEDYDHDAEDREDNSKFRKERKRHKKDRFDRGKRYLTYGRRCKEVRIKDREIESNRMWEERKDRWRYVAKKDRDERMKRESRDSSDGEPRTKYRREADGESCAGRRGRSARDTQRCRSRGRSRHRSSKVRKLEKRKYYDDIERLLNSEYSLVMYTNY